MKFGEIQNEPIHSLNISIITSSQDIASTGIQKSLLSQYPFKQDSSSSILKNKNVLNTFRFGKEINHMDLKFLIINVNVSMIRLDEYISPDEMPGDLLFFASKHQSQSGMPSLMCHTTGNFNEDCSAGGKPHKIAKGSGIVLHYFFHYLKAFVKSTNFDVPVYQEVTHHGPTDFRQPVSYIELGSTEKGWKDEKGANIVAQSIIETGIKMIEHNFEPPNTFKSGNIIICVGFGGGHYMPSFLPLINKNYTFVHTVAKYKIMALNPKKIQEIINQSLEQIQYWVVDWKGLNSSQKQHLIPLLEATNIPIKKTKELRPIS